ncbi:glutamate-cysteine ligase family protein [Legionella dresdenensis]|uniref:Glutamate-cysteine ligase family protein n=1 Tax=Legionella dresdenensis TaxID=450200 RepID=A0ABV8CE88_9GAMM
MSDYGIFSVIGIEIEYMLVNKETLNIAPQSDLILHTLAGREVNEVELDEIAASNELVMHVLELKNNGPKPPDAPLAAQFQETVNRLQPLLDKHQLQLLPSGAHPWMDPLTETRRWPYGNNEIYLQYDKIFNCQGHGWSNLQSMHVNLPFANDEQFNQLHNAIRLILPLLPALAASTPFLGGQLTGLLDSRLDFYNKNQQRIPSISGDIIPEFICSEDEYQHKILQPMYNDIAPFDPDKLLQYEWLNSRAAIPKFDYKAIEIRIIDSQECVNADIAIAKAILAILQHWQQQSDYYLTTPCDTQRLKALYLPSLKTGLKTVIEDRELLRQWQLSSGQTCRDIWSRLIEQVSNKLNHTDQLALEFILSQGSLSERLIKSCGGDFSKTALQRVYRQLGHCLTNNQQFNPT